MNSTNGILPQTPATPKSALTSTSTPFSFAPATPMSKLLANPPDTPTSKLLANTPESVANFSLPPSTPKTRPYSPPSKGHRRSPSVDLSLVYCDWSDSFELSSFDINVSTLSLNKNTSLTSIPDSPVLLGRGFEPPKVPVIDLDDITCHSEALKKSHSANSRLGTPFMCRTIVQLDEETNAEFITGDYTTKTVVDKATVATPRCCLIEHRNFKFPLCANFEEPSNAEDMYDFKELWNCLSSEEGNYSDGTASPSASRSIFKQITNSKLMHVKKKRKRSYNFTKIFTEKRPQTCSDD